MSWTLAHSRREWYSEPPVKRLGVGRPRCERRAPSVPPRMIVCTGSTPSAAHGLHRGLDHLGVLVDHLAHVPVLLLLGDLDRRARLALANLVGEPADQRDVLGHLRRVVVADDEVDDGLLGAAGDLRGMDEALALLGRLRRERVPRQARDQVGGELDRVDELSLGRAGMGRAAADRHGHLRRVERLGLDLAQLGAVERVGVAGAEALDVEVVSSARDLLVDREADADRRVLELGMPFQIGDRGHDLRHTGLVVGAEQRRPVGGDDVVTDLPLQQRELFGSRTTLVSPGSSIVPPS